MPTDAAALDAAAGEVAGEALGPVVAAAGGVDARSAAELGEVADERAFEHAALGEVFDEGGVGLVVHRGDDVFHALDRGEGFAAVDVPGDFVEHGEEGVDGDKSHACFDEATGEEAALAEAVHAVALADRFGLFLEVKCRAGFFAGHHAIGGLKVFVHQLGVGARFELARRCLRRFRAAFCGGRAGLRRASAAAEDRGL